VRLDLAHVGRHRSRGQVDTEPGLTRDGLGGAAPRHRRLGARLLPLVPEPAPRLPRGVVERRRLGRCRRPLRDGALRLTASVPEPGSMRERMLSGELYRADDPELAADRARAQELLERYNTTSHSEQHNRELLLHELFGSVGEGVVVNPPFRCDYGRYIEIGARTFVNYDCVLLDVAPIRIGAACQLATFVQLLTAAHPIDPEPRRDGWEYALPITIGDNVWLGGGVDVCPGVAIGDNTVVGAGAVVTRDLPADVVAAGVPARVLRAIGDA